MQTRPALLRLVADAADQIVHDFLSSSGFQLVPALAERTIRRYLVRREFRDVDIEVFRDPDWGIEGGRVRVMLRSLVHPVQQVVGGMGQSLLAPLPGTPLAKFDLGPHADDLPGSWVVHGAGDVGAFAAGLLAYLRDVAIPWLRKTESMDAVLDLLAELGQTEERERLICAWGRG